MCGRFTITLEPAFFQQEFELGKMPSEWQPRYNVAPSQDIPVVIDGEKRDVSLMRWGLIPHWAKDSSIGQRMINARAETISEKPSFRQAFEQRRCLILADGFYEWQKQASQKSPKVPFRFTLKDNHPLAFAGLWEKWRSPDDGVVQSCTIITCQPNELVAPIHNRMPVILDNSICWDWLSDLPASALSDLLKPFPADKMTAYPVGVWVNNPRFDHIKCIEPLSN